MEERLLKFVKVVECGSFTLAAQALHISQPALTTAIKKLERELQSTLLIRARHELRLTPAGNAAYAAGLAVMTQTRNLKTQLGELAQQKLQVSIGMIDSLAEAMFVHRHELTQLEADAHVSLTINNSALLRQDVLQHKLDMAIVVNAAAAHKLLTIRQLGAEPLVVVTRPDRLAAVKRDMQRGVLTDFLSYNHNSYTHRLLEQTALERGVELRPSFYSTGPEIMLELTLAGRGTAALPYLKVQKYLDSKQLSPVHLGPSCVVERPLAAIHYSEQMLPRPLIAMLDRCQVFLAETLKAAQNFNF